MDSWRDLVVATPDVLHGQVRFRGTRIPVAVVLDTLAEGGDEATLRKAYPTLPTGAIEAALKYAAAVVREREPNPGEVA